MADQGDSSHVLAAAQVHELPAADALPAVDPAMAAAAADDDQAPDGAQEQPEAPPRPTDEQILQFQNDIRAQEATKPYVGPLETLQSLSAEYVAGSMVFQRKIQRLGHTYSHMRRTRGDGNCFFRAFIFSYLEHLLVSGDVHESNRFSACIQAWRGKLANAGFQELVYEDALDLLLQHVSGIREGLLGVEALESAYCDDMASNLVVMLLRLITSAEVQTREDFFLPFILGMYDEPPPTVELFCQRYVEPMAEESDNIHIVALTDALQVPVRVVHLDRSGGAAGGSVASQHELDVNTHDFVPEACGVGATPFVHVLYRPGHYDVLYP